ncbi:MAG TPA: DUF2158 domain-containing protein [Casimicrobiaceae bacterium]
MASFKPGDIVKLKSGGPKMTVEGPYRGHSSNEEQVRCIWFEGSERKTDVFAVATLEAARGPSIA